jgi:mycoredoxin
MRWLWLPMLGLVAFVTISAVVTGNYWLAAVYAVVGAGLSYWLSPFQGGRSVTHADVVSMPEADRPVVVYWRPGCTYCARLRAALGSRGRSARWINIWQDPDAAAYVRSVNDGNETVPTVVIDGVAHPDPDPGLVRERLAA